MATIAPNQNVAELERGNRYRLEVYTSRVQYSEPQFTRTKTAARKLRATLQSGGYVVTIFEITPSGGLRLA